MSYCIPSLGFDGGCKDAEIIVDSTETIYDLS